MNDDNISWKSDVNLYLNVYVGGVQCWKKILVTNISTPITWISTEKEKIKYKIFCITSRTTHGFPHRFSFTQQSVNISLFTKKSVLRRRARCAASVFPLSHSSPVTNIILWQHSTRFFFLLGKNKRHAISHPFAQIFETENFPLNADRSHVATFRP